MDSGSFLADVQSQENEMDEIELLLAKQRKTEAVLPTSLQRPVCTTTAQIKLLHMTSRLCSELTKCRTLAEGGEAADFTLEMFKQV